MKVTVLGPSKTMYDLINRELQIPVTYNELEQILQIYPITELVTIRAQIFKSLIVKYSKQIRKPMKTFDKDAIDYADMVVLFYNPKSDHMSYRLRKIKKYLKKTNKIAIIKDYKQFR